MDGSQRMFVAIDVDDDGRDRLARELEALGRIGADVRWVRTAQLHLTLKFLGDVPHASVDDVRRALGDVAPHHVPIVLALDGLGRFPPRGRPAVFWAGVDGDVERLRDLARALELALEPLGFPREKRAFHPHVTLGRVRGSRNVRDLEALVERRGSELALPMSPARTFRLYRSELGAEGATHSVVEEFALGGSPGSL